jgi:L-lactate dehydrogenase complex protein LldF
LHHQLLAWRKEFGKRGLLTIDKTLPMRAASLLFRQPKLYQIAGRVARLAMRTLPRFVFVNRFNMWSRDRELPEPPAESFSQWYSKNRGQKNGRN